MSTANIFKCPLCDLHVIDEEALEHMYSNHLDKIMKMFMNIS